VVTLVSNIREQAESDTHLSRVVPSPPLFSVSWAPANFAFAFWANARPTPPEGEGEPERAKARPTCRPPGRQPVSQSVTVPLRLTDSLCLPAAMANRDAVRLSGVPSLDRGVRRS